MTGIEIFCGIVAVLLLLYYYSISTHNFWKKRGVAGPEPTPFFGNVTRVMFSQLSMGQLLREMYKKYKSNPVLGLFARKEPILIINDPELIKTILIKDFAKFSNRGITVNEKAEPLSQHLFALEPERWRPLRARLSPVFTSGRLKEMFFMIIDCSKSLEEHLEAVAVKGDPVDCRDLTSRFTTDVIGTCAFGINMNCSSDMESEFRKVGKQFLATSLMRVIRARIREIAPGFYTLFARVLPRPFGTDFFMDSVLNMIEYRKKNNIVRNDFINTLMDIREHPEKLGDIDLTDGLLTAQALIFFVAGFHSASATISNALLEMALNQDIQDKLREEIKEHHKLNNGEWHFENIKAMPILDAVFKETLRKYPALPFLSRKSVDDYTFEDLKFSIPKNTGVFIPVYGIQHDPDIYPNPEVFDITRFMGDAESKRHPMHYLPFGDGPRNCIGARFAIFQTKIGIIKTIRNYKVDTCENTVFPCKFNPRAFLLVPTHPITLKITKIKS
ncbi:putative cytochrome P450 6a14 [Megalopta genalis]|uniref:putative cytochrome P450 6a14 n=1 Tax=Megalopta genalis TaxID=115081 RepID=UPI003FD4996D